MSTSTDDRGRVEEQLRSTEARLAQTLRAIRAGVWEVELATGKNFWSDEAYRVLGYEPGEVEPSIPAVVARLHPDDRQHVLRQMGQVRGGGTLDLDFRIVCPDGAVRWVHQVASAEVDAQGTPVRVRGHDGHDG